MNSIHADPLYYARREYAQALVRMMAEGVVSAFTLFAPRRMGKTEFLLNDVRPVAEENGFGVFYFSFMDAGKHTEMRFLQALLEFAHNRTTSSKIKHWLAAVQSVEFLGAGISRQRSSEEISVSEVIDALATGKQPVLMLLDEVQEIARLPDTGGLVRSLRTGLDVNKGKVKVIFTGSSINGLRQMFHDHKAPFFQFAHQLDFPLLTRDFTDFLADLYVARTAQAIDKAQAWAWFQRFEHIPLHMRTIIQNMIINPALSLDDAAQAQWQYLHEHSEHSDTWRNVSALERLLLVAIAQGQGGLYAEEYRRQLASRMGVEDVSISQIQAALRRLQRADVLMRTPARQWAISQPDMQAWIREHHGDAA